MMRMVRWAWPLAALIAIGAIAWGLWSVGHSPNRADLSTYWAFVVGVIAAIAAVIAAVPALRPGRNDATLSGQPARADPASPSSSLKMTPDVQPSAARGAGPPPNQGSGTQNNRFDPEKSRGDQPSESEPAKQPERTQQECQLRSNVLGGPNVGNDGTGANRLEHLRRLLDVHERNIQRLEEQDARFAGVTPIHILSQLDDERRRVADIKSELVELGDQR